MSPEGFPWWALVPFPALVGAIAVLPIAAPHAWERWRVQASLVAVAILPVVAFYATAARTGELVPGVEAYASFAAMLGALYVTAGGVHLEGELDATPATNAAFVLAGGLLASLVGTTGASMLLVRPFLRANMRRDDRSHLVPFFILVVANAGGLLTPLGDPPLLVGYISGVPFFWTLRLLPAWALYVGSLTAALYVLDRRRCPASRPVAAGALRVRGRRNLALLLALVPAALLPFGAREAAMIAIAGTSLALTPRGVRQANGFGFGPIIEVAILFAGIFVTLAPVQATVEAHAASLPLSSPWQLFWASGALSAVLDNAPTYSAFSALARGLGAGVDGVAGIAPLRLAAISIGTVVMGATTYIGNGPNLMVQAIARRERFPTPSFARYAAFAFAAMLPAHLITTLVLALLGR
jgi:Na+/H+ antiporter NhaD/arsenite permease-like protein